MRRNYSVVLVSMIAVLFLVAGYIIGNNYLTPGGKFNNNPDNSIGGAAPTGENITSTTIPSVTEAHSDNKQTFAASIRYTDNGYDPSIVTIKKGESVQWVNDSTNGEMWVASNPHPQHSDYPGFDQLQGVAKGSIYTFTFNNAGIWGYHNHLSPDKTGRVIVL